MPSAGSKEKIRNDIAILDIIYRHCAGELDSVRFAGA